MPFEMLETETSGTVIKVVGVGGAGGNAVEHMIRREVQNVDFIVANTDRQALRKSSATNLLQLGKTGLGAGAKPEVGRQAADEMRERIADALRGAHMVFITAGMGGGTGTGAAPVVAEIAKELGILTVAVVSKPFEFEGPRRMKIAEQGLAELEDKVHSLIVILNNKLEEVMGEDAEMDACFKAATTCCTRLRRHCRDHQQQRPRERRLRGRAHRDERAGQGDDGHRAGQRPRPRPRGGRAGGGQPAAGGRGSVRRARRAGQHHRVASLKMKETREVMNTIRAFAAEDATVIFGTVKDESMGDELRVTVVATGLGRTAARKQPQAFTVIKTGTDNAPIGVVPSLQCGRRRHSTGHDYADLDKPAIWRSRADAQARVAALEDAVSDRYDIPAFLRKQAD